MGRILIISGFLGAGKTTLIRRILDSGWGEGPAALLENEFGTCGVDDLLLRRKGLVLRTLASGCICCSLAGVFRAAIEELAREVRPGLLLVEPSGVAGLSDLLRVCRALPPELGFSRVSAITVVDGEMHPCYAEEMGDFYLDQIHRANAVVCTKLDLISPEQRSALGAALAAEHPAAAVFCCPWEALDLPALLEQAEQAACPAPAERRHQHGSPFTALSLRPGGCWEPADLEARLLALGEPGCGRVLRAKGLLPGRDGWIQADYTPGRAYVRPWTGEKESLLTVIGAALDEARITGLFPQNGAGHLD